MLTDYYSVNMIKTITDVDSPDDLMLHIDLLPAVLVDFKNRMYLYFYGYKRQRKSHVNCVGEMPRKE